MPGDPEISLGELWRTVQTFKEDFRSDLTESRQDTQRAIAKIELGIQEVRAAIQEAPFVHQQVYEVVRKEQGKRVGDLEDALKNVSQRAWGAVVSVGVAVVLLGLEALTK